MAISKGRPERGIRGAGNYLILLIPYAGVADINAIKVAEVAASTAIDITYSFTPDGYNHAPSFEEIKDDRLTLKQAMTEDGPRTDSLTLTIVASGADSVADKAIVVGEEYVLFHRPFIAHDTDLAADQEYFAHPVRVSSKTQNIAVGNAMQTKTVRVGFIDEPADNKKLVAA